MMTPKHSCSVFSFIVIINCVSKFNLIRIIFPLHDSSLMHTVLHQLPESLLDMLFVASQKDLVICNTAKNS